MVLLCDFTNLLIHSYLWPHAGCVAAWGISRLEAFVNCKSMHLERKRYSKVMNRFLCSRPLQVAPELLRGLEGCQGENFQRVEWG